MRTKTKKATIKQPVNFDFKINGYICRQNRQKDMLFSNTFYYWYFYFGSSNGEAENKILKVPNFSGLFF